MTRPQETSAYTLARHERADRVLELRRKGKTFQEIAVLVGCSNQTAWNDVKRAIARLVRQQTENAEGLRALEELRLNKMLASISDLAESGDLKCQEMVLKIMDRRSKLRGLDAPVETKTRLSFGSMTDGELEQEARRAGIVVPVEILDDNGRTQKALEIMPTASENPSTTGGIVSDAEIEGHKGPHIYLPDDIGQGGGGLDNGGGQ